MLDDEERETARVQVADPLLDLLDHHGVHAGGRLVEQNEPRLAHQHRRELEQLLLAVREPPGLLLREPRQAELLEQLVRACSRSARRTAG